MNLDNETVQILKEKLERVVKRQVPGHYEDITQETLRILLENVQRDVYIGEPSVQELTAYAFGIVKILNIKYVKDLKGRVERFSPLEAVNVESITVGENPESILLDLEQRDHMAALAALAQKHLKDLPAQCQKLVKLHAVDGLSYSQLSRALGKPKQTLVSQFNACMKTLRIKIKAELHTKSKSR